MSEQLPATTSAQDADEGNDGWSDFMSFRRMITPYLIQILFVIACAVVVIAGIVVTIIGFKHGRAREGVAGIGLIIFGPLVVRLWAEALNVVFRINETLTDLRSLAIWTAEREHNYDVKEGGLS